MQIAREVEDKQDYDENAGGGPSGVSEASVAEATAGQRRYDQNYQDEHQHDSVLMHD